MLKYGRLFLRFRATCLIISSSDSKEITRVISGPENTIKASLECFSRVRERHDTCSDSTLPSVILSTEPIRDAYASLKERGARTRFLTNITKENLSDCKALMKIVSELRHLEGVKGNFAVADVDYMASASQFESAPIPQIIHSNVKAVIEQQQYIFETLWKQSVPAEQKIREMEEGVEPEFVDVITDGHKATEIIADLAKSVKKEARLLLPHAMTMVRADKLGMWDYLVQAATNGAEIRVICPLSEDNASIVKRLLSVKNNNIKIIEGKQTESGLFIADDEKYFRAEDKNASDASDASDAISLLVYSNSKKGVNLYKSFFDALWTQTELYEKLKMHGKMQEEFINIAAHELRNPIQPIVGLSEVLLDQFPSNSKQAKMMNVILRSAKRLQNLQEDILDVSRIESDLFRMDLAKFNLDDVIRDTMSTFAHQMDATQKRNIKTIYNNGTNGATIVADKSRISRVLYNMLENALKFTEKGAISVSSSLSKDGAVVIVSVKDTGIGIDPEIFPRLFTKFAAKSHKGTGLGLYISKNIIESHGGRIWAEKGQGKTSGATFCFSLPLKKQSG